MYNFSKLANFMGNKVALVKQKISNLFWLSFGIALTTPVFAGIPTSTNDLNVSNGWIAGLSGFAKIAIALLLTIVSVGIFVSAAGGITKAYTQAREKSDLSHFATWAFGAVILIVIGGACVYAAYQVYSS